MIDVPTMVGRLRITVVISRKKTERRQVHRGTRHCRLGYYSDRFGSFSNDQKKACRSRVDMDIITPSNALSPTITLWYS
jgi:hypothetical protein